MLPPYVYQNAQQGAPESLVIKVLSVKQAVGDDPGQRRSVTKTTCVTVEAQVEAVGRSRSGLKPGSVIRIHYIRGDDDNEPMPGAQAWEPPILEKGQTCPAYLKRDKPSGNYVPEAGACSFEALPVLSPKEKPRRDFWFSRVFGRLLRPKRGIEPQRG